MRTFYLQVWAERGTLLCYAKRIGICSQLSCAIDGDLLDHLFSGLKSGVTRIKSGLKGSMWIG